MDIMDVKEYNFLEFTDKDFFNMRLAGIQPDFRYIGDSKRAAFIQFCIKNGFIKYRDKDIHEKAVFYSVLIPFRYQAMFNYSIRPVVITEDTMLLVYADGRLIPSRGKI